MHDEFDDAPFATRALRMFTVIFTMSILAMCVMGLLATRNPLSELTMREGRDLFSLVEMGTLPLRSILQMAGFSAVMSCVGTLLFSARFFPKMRAAWRTFFFLLANIFIVSAFAAVFEWIPTDVPRAWAVFIITCALASIAATALAHFKHWLESKRYDKLLADFKARRKSQ